MHSEISAFLKSKLNSVYCDTCESNNSQEDCEECHRKMMNWSASQSFCDILAETILENFISNPPCRKEHNEYVSDGYCICPDCNALID